MNYFIKKRCCLIEETKILTSIGYKNIEDITTKDIVLTHTGKFQKIILLQNNIYTGYIYKLDINHCLKIIKCTDEHLFYTCEKNKTPIWKYAKDLTKNDYFGMIINTNSILPKFVFDKNIKSEKNKITLNKKEYLYIIGFCVSNKCFEEINRKENTANYIIKFIINKSEQKVYEKIQNILSIKEEKSNINDYKKYSCSNYIWFKIFKTFSKYPYQPIIPEWLHDSPKELIQEFIYGYLKIDKNITKNKLIEITTISLDFAFGLQRLLLKLGYIFSINKQENKVLNQYSTYIVSGYFKSYSSSFIEDKYVWYSLNKITKIKAVNTLVYNIKVKKSDSYIAENIIVS